MLAYALTEMTYRARGTNKAQVNLKIVHCRIKRVWLRVTEGTEPSYAMLS